MVQSYWIKVPCDKIILYYMIIDYFPMIFFVKTPTQPHLNLT